MDKILPFESDENKFRYTKDELNWCKENEEYIWRFIIDEKLLYNKEPALVDPFFQEGPYTKAFGPDSPSTIGIWMGYEMIKDYVDNTNVDIVELMKENNIQKLPNIMNPDKERKETLTVDVIMDENMIPESINWSSTQENDKKEEASAALMYFWNAKNKETFNLDLWTKKCLLKK